ncbi:MAG: SIMPL domain-containing protein [Prevotellaceae bacterium]|nr:SIMPL domain-containing protein [Prevotellaceae bacterium]
MKDKIISSAIIAAGIVVLGLCIKWGIDDFVNKDRQVTVKGLAEVEVEADKATWPVQTKVMGNDLSELYDQASATQKKTKDFFIQNGIKAEDIMLGAMSVEDLEANEWSENKKSYRYIVTSNLTITSKNVALVRTLVNRQGELLKQGIAFANGYNTTPSYEYVAFKDKKAEMMKEAISNAQKTAEQFAENSQSSINKIVKADQGQFSIENASETAPWMKKIRVVTTVTYSLKD